MEEQEVKMSEEEDCDDLPSITVNTSANNSSTFAMPSAEQLAEQRARDLHSQRQLEELRRRARDLEPAPPEPAAPELALAAAVTALSVRAERPPPARAAELWAALAPQLAPPAAALLEPLREPAPLVRARLAQAVAAVARALAAAPGAWPPDELAGAAALLSAAVLARESRCSRAAARALHALLDDHATPDQVETLTSLLLAALPETRARMRLGDALRSGARAGADVAASALTAAAALSLLRAPSPTPAASDPTAAGLEHVVRAWRSGGAVERGACVALAGRLLAAAGAGAAPQCARLLPQLAPPPAAAADAHRPDRLKALVGISKLKLLFSAKNGTNSQTQPQPDIK